MFGSAVPDVAPPSVSVTRPADGDTFAVGSNFDIEAEATDDVGIRDVALIINGEEYYAISSAPYRWEINSIPEGEYEIAVVATDTAALTTQSASVWVYVGEDSPPEEGGTAGTETGDPVPEDDDQVPDDDDDDSGGQTPHGHDSGDADGPLPSGLGDLEGESAEVGCACRSSVPTQGVWNALWLLVVGVAMRRRG